MLHRGGAGPPLRGGGRARHPACLYPGRPGATFDSAPLPELVRAINKDSNNLMARNLLLSMAPGFSPTTSTLDLARQRLALWFKKVGVAARAPKVDNGSGLANSEQGSVLAMVQLLQTAWGDPKTQKVFLASLPVAGADGTLAGRFKGSPAQRNAFLKTGTLTGVRSLAGYVRGQSGQMIAVAIVVNSEQAGAAGDTRRVLEEAAARRRCAACRTSGWLHLVVHGHRKSAPATVPPGRRGAGLAPPVVEP